MFALDPAFATTSAALGELRLCHARLQQDARFPWIVLIPRRPGLRELEDLGAADRQAVMDEILAAGRAVRAVGETLGRPVAKLNVGQLGNLTPQLHVHVIGRRPDDPAWPGPVWGHGAAQPYAPNDLATALAAASQALVL
jgi:diadenosine tetraphosphate (Ap4A) HIT family hydrolase